MTIVSLLLRAATGAILSVATLAAGAAAAADHPAPKEADWIARDFKFHTGDVMSELREHYTTIGDPSGEPVIILHGTAEAVVGQILRLREEIGLDYLLCAPLSHESFMLLTEKVLPRL